jgi:tRNA A37 threonylcarbamoyladenosine synthetase subunit TsaC/SUA5/YrdC
MMSRRFASRLLKIEAAVGQKGPFTIIVHSRDEAQEKIREYEQKYPGLRLPTILVAERIIKPTDSGLAR